MKKTLLYITTILFASSSSLFAQGDSMDFDGSAVTLSTGGSNDINLLIVTDRTIECWFQPDDVNNSSKQVIYEEGGRNKGFNIYMQSGTLYCGAWANDGLFDAGTYLTTTAIANGQWYHIAITLNGATSSIQNDIFKS
jgi:hypothetical protein